MDILKYRGYEAKIRYSAEDEGLVGEILYINDVIHFFGENHQAVLEAFHEAVDSYLALCAERGESPNRPFKGSFNIRISPDLHKELLRNADRLNISLNQMIASVLENFLKEQQHLKLK